MSESSSNPDPSERFSLVAGGPFHELCSRLSLSSPVLAHVGRRSALVVALAWLPLLALTLIEGSIWKGTVPVPFFFDFEVHLRFLVALPLLFLAELPVHERLAKAVRQFSNRGLVRERDRPRFEAIVASTHGWRDSWLGELAVLAVVYLVGRQAWLGLLSLDTATWYATPGDSGELLSWAGQWLVWVSVPIFQFVLYRWLFRLALWVVFLVRVSRLDFDLVPTHPDRAGGLGFLGTNSLGFSVLLASVGVLLSGTIANFIFFDGARLPQYKLEIAGMVAALLLLILGPLTAFTPKLLRVRRAGLGEYGTLAMRYVRGFDAKWLRGAGGGAGEATELMGSADIQSLADLANSYEIVRTMRSVPFGRETAFKLAAAVIAPILPLALTMIPLEELLDRLISVLF